ncbi:MAG: SIS domain-containing protein [Gemmatimonadota bacterium]|nr:SIS domain-containing protein [Gemmatimonadota bacterium]
MGRVGIRSGLSELATVAALVAETLRPEITEYATRALATVAGGNKLMFCGNGGSAADAQHLAAEYVVRLAWSRPALPALALTTDTSVLTACANDRGYDEVFARQVAALGRPGDLLVIHSTSGDSANLIRAASQAERRGMAIVGLLAGSGGQLNSLVDIAVLLPTERVSRAQEVHLAIGHIVCRYVEESLFGDVDEHTGNPLNSEGRLSP